MLVHNINMLCFPSSYYILHHFVLLPHCPLVSRCIYAFLLYLSCMTLSICAQAIILHSRINVYCAHRIILLDYPDSYH
ncbi:hypothetical protein L208DRAFT_577700 [Tricholoma matsutake]|nr:hypothetical protein L208DRAFT_577700 [Tricholoma matsutake 945]